MYLTAINWFTVYGMVILRHFDNVRLILDPLTYWNFLSEQGKPILAVLLLGFIAFACWDFKEIRTGTSTLAALGDQETVTPNSMFEDPKVPFVKCGFVFITVMLLFAFCVNMLLVNVILDAKGYLFWVAATLLQLHLSIPAYAKEEDHSIKGFLRWATRMNFDMEKRIWIAVFSKNYVVRVADDVGDLKVIETPRPSGACATP